MARTNRSELFDPTTPGAYHCIQRVVRRAMLCGYDFATDKSYDHRRGWIEERLKTLAASFGIDLLNYAVMSNHCHMTLRNRPDVVETWTNEEVARRWWSLFPKRKNKDKTPAEPTENDLKSFMAPGYCKQLRARLSDISWWMRSFAEPIARRSNKEDGAKGRFWEGRFKSQRLADETALLACSAYIDLNPIRAGLVDSIDKSNYTSAYTRIQASVAYEKEVARRKRKKCYRKRAAQAKREGRPAPIISVREDAFLAPIMVDERASAYAGAMPSKNGRRASDKGYLHLSSEAYLKFVDWTGRQIRHDGKKGRIPYYVEPILKRLGLSSEMWCDTVKRYSKIFKSVAGTPETLAREAIALKRGKFRSSNSPLPS